MPSRSGRDLRRLPAAVRRQVLEWDDRLYRSGFVDIEAGPIDAPLLGPDQTSLPRFPGAQARVIAEGAALVAGAAEAHRRRLEAIWRDEIWADEAPELRVAWALHVLGGIRWYAAARIAGASLECGRRRRPTHRLRPYERICDWIARLPPPVDEPDPDDVDTVLAGARDLVLATGAPLPTDRRRWSLVTTAEAVRHQAGPDVWDLDARSIRRALELLQAAGRLVVDDVPEGVRLTIRRTFRPGRRSCARS